MSYQQEREQFIYRVTREGLPLHVTTKLLRAATTLQRYAELSCSSEAADRDRVPCPATKIKPTTRNEAAYPCLCDYDAKSGVHNKIPRITLQADRLERRIAKVFNEVNTRRYPAGVTDNDGQRRLWEMDTQGDPRGYVLRVIPPSYAERNKGKDRGNLDTIGVPSGPSRLRF